MNIEIIQTYLNLYGYFIIFLLLFFGIVGIPAPEESLLFLIGVLISQDKLSIEVALLSAFLGTLSGMLVAFIGDKYIGHPLINKYGKYVGITHERWIKYKYKIHKAILLGFYMPGLR